MKSCIKLFIIWFACGTGYDAVEQQSVCPCQPATNIIGSLSKKPLPNLECLQEFLNIGLSQDSVNCLDTINRTLTGIPDWDWKGLSNLINKKPCDQEEIANWFNAILPSINAVDECICKIITEIIEKSDRSFCPLIKCLLNIISSIIASLICLAISIIKDCIKDGSEISDSLLNVLILFAKQLLNLVRCTCPLARSVTYLPNPCMQPEFDNLISVICCLTNVLGLFNNDKIDARIKPIIEAIIQTQNSGNCKCPSVIHG